MVAAIAISGRLDFNPITDLLVNEEGDEVKLDPPTGLELPPKGFDVEDNGYLAPLADGSSVNVIVKENSERLELLTPFEPWDGKNLKCKTSSQSIREMYDRPHIDGRTMVTF